MLYKLTRQDFTTRSGCLWGENVTHTADGQGALCSEHWLHAYEHPLIAVFMNPIHGNFKNPVLWECNGVVGTTDYGLKVGCTSLTTLRQIPLPKVTMEQCVRFAIACAVSVCQEPSFISWAVSWLDGTDRLEETARVAARTVWAAGATGETAGASRAARAARAVRAARAAGAAEYTARAMAGCTTRATAKCTARATEFTAQTAALAAARTPVEEEALDLIACAEWAVSDSAWPSENLC